MRVEFRFADDVSALLESMQAGPGVNVTLYRGVCRTHVHPPGEACPDVQSHTVCLTKAEARAVASALMGCAAEL